MLLIKQRTQIQFVIVLVLIILYCINKHWRTLFEEIKEIESNSRLSVLGTPLLLPKLLSVLIASWNPEIMPDNMKFLLEIRNRKILIICEHIQDCILLFPYIETPLIIYTYHDEYGTWNSVCNVELSATKNSV